jgi:hypothetical protein
MVQAVARGLGTGIAFKLYPAQPGWCAHRLKPLHDMLEAVGKLILFRTDTHGFILGIQTVRETSFN